MRVRQIPEQTKTSATVNEKRLNLLEDRSFTVKSGEDISVQFGRLQRMHRRLSSGSGRKNVDYKDCVPFSSDYLKDLRFTVLKYNELEPYTYDIHASSNELVEISALDIVCQVNMCYSFETNCLTLNMEDYEAIQQCVKTRREKRKRTSNTSRQSRQSNQNEDFDGRVSETVVPVVPRDGKRSSQRTRKKITFLCWTYSFSKTHKCINRL